MPVHLTLRTSASPLPLFSIRMDTSSWTIVPFPLSVEHGVLKLSYKPSLALLLKLERVFVHLNSGRRFGSI
ncbi:hypothetical protein LshimejAT787_0904180 [Lyophyllum shimeji]|uniref:Uncharacterized protein n=1 Tax=Lyophyllum shimeji TaxID=47721 RepID=A0A9P3PSE9_LYOSH|nr:hypothetical protein LshimejAT787_0904180 [Lyophyllum shimeji]